MTGPPPKENRRRRNQPARGDWLPAPGVGWQHGDVPAPPPRMLKASRDVWATWFAGWFAAFWTLDDVPALRQVIRLYDQVERGQFQRAPELRMWMDSFGISPKGQQDRRWKRPDPGATGATGVSSPPSSRYGHLRAVTDHDQGEPA